MDAGIPESCAMVDAVRKSVFEFLAIFGADGKFREVNSLLAQLLGLTIEEVEGRSLLDVIHPDDIPRTVASLFALESGKNEVAFETRFAPSDGVFRHIQWVGRQLSDSTLFWAVGRETSEFHRVLAESQDYRLRLELAIGLEISTMWEFDFKTKRITWEPTIAALLGLALELVPQDLDQFLNVVNPKDRALLALAMATLESNGSIEVGIWIGQSVGGRYLSVRGKVLDRTRRGKALRAIGLLIDKTAEKAMEERMLSMAMSDGLTGIANRRSFDGSLRSEWRRCKRALDPITLVMIDIDNFKMFNDTYGHLVGDEAIRAIASSLLALLNREGDFVARFGGEEFAMILPATDFDGAKKVGEKIVREIRKIKLSQASDWNFSVSVGTATTTFLKDPGRSVDLLSKSDEALYEAKHEGKDRWVSKTL